MGDEFFLWNLECHCLLDWWFGEIGCDICGKERCCKQSGQQSGWGGGGPHLSPRTGKYVFNISKYYKMSTYFFSLNKGLGNFHSNFAWLKMSGSREHT